MKNDERNNAEIWCSSSDYAAVERRRAVPPNYWNFIVLFQENGRVARFLSDFLSSRQVEYDGMEKNLAMNFKLLFLQIFADPKACR